jgi:hypothetical protein
VELLPLRNSGATRAYEVCTKVGLRQPLWPSRETLEVQGRRRGPGGPWPELAQKLAQRGQNVELRGQTTFSLCSRNYWW